MLRTPDGPSFAMYPNFCPYRQQFGRFYNNSVHSVGRFGVWIFPEYSPTVGGSCSGDSPMQAVFDGLYSWNNNRGFESVMSSSIQVRNSITFDNHDTGIRCTTAIKHQFENLANLRTTFYNENTGSSVINSIIIGDTGISGTPIVPGEGGLVGMFVQFTGCSCIKLPSLFVQSHVGSWIKGAQHNVHEFPKCKYSGYFWARYCRPLCIWLRRYLKIEVQYKLSDENFTVF